MRFREALREVARTSRAQKVSSGIVAFLTAAMCLVIILTLGKSTIAAQNIDQQLDSPQARRMAVVRSNTTPAFRPSILTSIATLDDVEIAVADDLISDIHVAVLRVTRFGRERI